MTRCVLLIALLVALVVPSAAAAARNGAIGFTHDNQLFSVRADGSGARQLTRGTAEPTDPAYSRDGRNVAVQRRDSLVVLSPSTGREIRRVPVDLDWIEDPAWSPGGTTLVFTACDSTVFTDTEECAQHGIYRVRLDGSGLRRLGSGQAPVWSPDGRSIAYVAETGTRADSCPVLSLVPAAGGESRPVLPLRSDGRCPRAGQPDFSPGGTRLVYTSSPHIRSVKLDGSGEVIVARAPRGAGAWQPHWSPDGRFVAYGQGGSTAQTGLWTVRWGGGTPRRVTGRSAVALDWAPMR